MADEMPRGSFFCLAHLAKYAIMKWYFHKLKE